MAFFLLFLFASSKVIGGSYYVPSASMQPTLQPGDYIIARRYRQHSPSGQDAVQYGDVVVFSQPHQPHTLYVSRIVGLGGDTLSFSDGTLIINDQSQPQVQTSTSDDYDHYQERLQGHTHHIQFAHDPRRRITAQGQVTIPAGHYFVMGDNRDNALDGRFWTHSATGATPTWYFLPQENIIGKAAFIWLNRDCLKQQTHCDRIGQTIH